MRAITGWLAISVYASLLWLGYASLLGLYIRRPTIKVGHHVYRTRYIMMAFAITGSLFFTNAVFNWLKDGTFTAVLAIWYGPYLYLAMEAKDYLRFRNRHMGGLFLIALACLTVYVCK